MLEIESGPLFEKAYRLQLSESDYDLSITDWYVFLHSVD